MNLNQLIALIRLRFQLTLNQIKKGGAANSILFVIIAAVIVLTVVSSFFSAIVFGAIWIKEFESNRILLMWNVISIGFLVAWIFNVMNRIQQSDAISIDKLLHLPITFHGAFILNFVSTFANFTLLSVAPVMIGIAIAMPIARGWSSAVAIPLTLSFLFMATAITYQFRNWLAAKMENKRTRAIMMGVLPLVFIGLFVAVGELTDSESVLSLFSETPIGWLTSGVVAADSGDWLSGIFGTLAMTAIAGASLFFAYRSSMRKFTGTGPVRAAGKSTQRTGAATAWLDSRMLRSFPLVSAPVSTVAYATWTNLRRAPEIFAALIPLIAITIFGTPYLIGMKDYVIPDWSVSILPLGLIAIALVGFPAFLFSTFSYDRDGFRAFILSPVQRKDVLLGKNLAIGIPTIVVGWITLIIVQCRVPIGPLWFLGHIVFLPVCYLIVCMIGNAISIFFAVGLKRGSMTPVNARVIPVVLLYVGILVGPFVAMLPTFMAHFAVSFLEVYVGWPMGWLYLLLSIPVLLVTWLVYRKSLEGLGNWLWTNESKILDIVAKVPE